MANMVNSCIIEGNLVKDGVLSYTPNGVAILKGTIAYNKSYKRGEEWVQEVSYFDFELWGLIAERFQQYLKKGNRIRVVGKLKQDRWQDKDGKTRSAVKVVAEHIEYFKNAPKVEQSQDVQEPKAELDFIPF